MNQSSLRLLVALVGLSASAVCAAFSAAILDIGPGATDAQTRTVVEIARRIGEDVVHDVLPPLRAYLAVRNGQKEVVGYIKRQTLPQVGDKARLTVPVHVSRRGLYESGSSDAPTGVVLLRGYVYDVATRNHLKPYPITLVNDDAAAVDMLRKARVRFAVLDEHIFENTFAETGLRKLITVENVSLHFAVTATAEGLLASIDEAVCGMWRDGTLFELHRAFYPARSSFDAVREDVLLRYC